MTKRKDQSESEQRIDGYADAECPECGATITTHFQRGRNWRKLQCPVCRRHVTLTIESEEATLVQLRRAGAE